MIAPAAIVCGGDRLALSEFAFPLVRRAMTSVWSAPNCTALKACVARARRLPPKQRGKSKSTRRSRQRRSSALHGLRASWRSQAHSSSRGRHARTERPCRGCADGRTPPEAALRKSQRSVFRASRDHPQRVVRPQESTRRVAVYASAAKTPVQVEAMNPPQRPKEHTATARVNRVATCPRCAAYGCPRIGRTL